MKYDFDQVIERRGTYAIKWHGDITSKVTGKPMHWNEDTIPMMTADMDLPSPQPLIDAMHRVAEHKMFGYSFPQCEPKYTQSLQRWFRDRHDWEIREEEIIPSHGTFGALTHAAMMRTKEGDGVILMNPVYGHFSKDVVKWNRVVKYCHLLCDEEGYYTIDFEKLEELCADPNNTLLIFCSPANPVGRVWTEDEVRKVAQICRKHNVFVLSDEVHCDHLRKGEKHTPFLKVCEDKSQAIVLVGINKSFNTAGLACSNAIIQDEGLRAEFMATYGLTFATPFSIAAQVAAYTEGDEWMDQVCEYIEGNIDWAIDFFKKEMPKVKIRKPEGTYCLWMDFRAYGISDEEIHQRIYVDANVVLQDGTVHDPEQGQGFQRMCLPCARSVLQTACERIVAAFQDLN